MKKALLIVAIVAGYSALETALLLSVIVRSPLDQFPSARQVIVGWGQFVLIPGMAALMSRIIHGPYQSFRRTLMILLAGALGMIIVPLAAFILFGFLIFALIWACGINRILFAVLLPVVLSAVLWTFVFLVRKTGKWSVRAESERWLAERESGTRRRDRVWRNRGIRFAMCIPPLIALTIFLFLPETWGLVSHLRWPHCGVLSGYKVRVPANWIIFYYQSEEADGRSYVNGLAGRGIALGGNPLRYDSLSWWTVKTVSSDDLGRIDYDRWPPKPGDILEQRSIKIAGVDLECVDYWPSYQWAPPRSESATIAYVDCSGTNRLQARFEGRRNQLPQFYDMLSGIMPVK